MENKNEILKNLSSGNEELINNSIEEIRREGTISIIPELLDILAKIEDTYTSKILATLSDIKEIEIKQVLIDRIISSTDENEKINLLQVCWQSPLDFSEYLNVFVKLLETENIVLALEVFTVIENLDINHIPKEDIQIAIDYLKNEEQNCQKEFYGDIINLLEDALDFEERDDDDHDEDCDCGCHVHHH